MLLVHILLALMLHSVHCPFLLSAAVDIRIARLAERLDHSGSIVRLDKRQRSQELQHVEIMVDCSFDLPVLRLDSVAKAASCSSVACLHMVAWYVV